MAREGLKATKFISFPQMTRLLFETLLLLNVSFLFQPVHTRIVIQDILLTVHRHDHIQFVLDEADAGLLSSCNHRLFVPTLNRDDDHPDLHRYDADV